MRKSLLILLLLAACDRQPRSVSGEEPQPGPSDLSLGLDPALPKRDPAELQAIVATAMAGTLPNATSARYRGLRDGSGGAVCGEVSTGAEGTAAPFLPFIVRPAGQAIVASSPTIAFGDPFDSFAEAWIEYCATPEELNRLKSELPPPPDNAATYLPPPAIPMSEPPPPEAEDILADPEPQAPARPRTPPPPPQVDSFFNSVQRKDD